MPIERILVCEAQVPFVRGGAELLVRQLVERLRLAGYDTELVSVPFKWYPKEEILAHAAAWRLLDLSESNGRRIDLVIATKFPTYFVRHPNKVTWLVHQYRAAYELCGTAFSDFEDVERDVGLRDRIVQLDRHMIRESRRVFTIARTVSDRLRHYNGLVAEPLYHPSRLADRLYASAYGDYVLSVGRIESIKRVDLAVRAIAHVPRPIRLVVAGEGTQDAAVRQAAIDCGVADRVQFVGTVDDDALAGLYAEALAVVFVPYAEDYGYVTLEAMQAARPVVTTHDAGGPLEFIAHGVNGLVVEPDPAAVGRAIADLAADREHAAAIGASGRARAQSITWDGVIEQLVGEGGSPFPGVGAATTPAGRSTGDEAWRS